MLEAATQDQDTINNSETRQLTLTASAVLNKSHQNDDEDYLQLSISNAT